MGTLNNPSKAAVLVAKVDPLEYELSRAQELLLRKIEFHLADQTGLKVTDRDVEVH